MLAALAMLIQTPLASELEAIRAKYGLPSICAGAVVDGRVVALDAVGVRCLGSDERATVDDRYHIGSNTKAFTATLAAMMVERGKLAWDAPLARLLPRLAKDMDLGYLKATPLQLATHRAGFTGETYTAGMPDWRAIPMPITAQRQDYARHAVAFPPTAKPGERFEYSNRGYIVLGAILEELTHRPWEDLVATEILKPLGLTSAGFGPVPKGGPWGHVEEGGKLTPVPPGPLGDNALVLGPAGTLHMSVRDMLAWCAFQADEGRRGGLLKPEAFRVLHTPPRGGDYAGGWIAVPRDWAGGNALTHSGSNTMNYQTVWVAPAKRFAVVVSTNCAVPKAHEAVDKACGLLIGRFCPR